MNSYRMVELLRAGLPTGKSDGRVRWCRIRAAVNPAVTLLGGVTMGTSSPTAIGS